MHTPTHMLLGAALFGRTGGRPDLKLGLIAVAGGLLPDLPAFILVAGAVARGMDPETIFRTAYFSPSWQAIMVPWHSVPLWLAGLTLAALLRSRWGLAFAASGLLHQAGDFPLHAEDAHRHFWPLTNWRFESPVSYWDPAHYGLWVQPLEIVLGLGLLAVLWRRWPRRWIRGALVLTGLAYLAQVAAAAALLSA